MIQIKEGVPDGHTLSICCESFDIDYANMS